MNNGKGTSFEAEMDRLGLIAVKAKGTDDFPQAFRKLLNYFKSEDGYFKFLLIKHGQMERFKRTGEYNPDVQNEYFAGLEVAEKLLKKKIESFDPELGSKDKYPFFGFVSKDLFHISKAYAKEQDLLYGKEIDGKIVMGRSMVMNKKDRAMIEKINRLRDSMEYSGAGSDTVGKICESLGISEDKYYSLMRDSNTVNTVSFDQSFSEDNDENNLHNRIADSSGHTPDGESVKTETENNWLGFSEKDEDFEEILRQIDRIIRESFLEKHKKTFPYEWTNKYIIGIVEEYQQKDSMLEREYSAGRHERTGRYLNFEQTVEKYWDDLQIEDRHKYYGTGRFLCMKDEIFCWFEIVRRRIQAKEIAEKISKMTPSTYNKTCSQAMELIQKKLAVIQ